MADDSSDRLLGSVLDDRYRITERIARGGMAKVYLAEDVRLERQVAIKIMHDHLTEDSEYATKFIREARHTARLAHPNIMSVFDQGHVGGTLYLVMEYLPGMTLRELLNDYGTLTIEQTLDITTAVLQGLGVAHREGILHRDVKPENIILVNDGRIKIGDFGLARPVNNATDTGAQLLGTVAYIAPELLTRTTADNRSDLYSVGILLYEMLTGKQPFTGDTPMQVAMQHAQAPMPFASATNPTVSRAIDDVIQWATQKVPADRPRDARAMLDALRHAVDKGVGVPAPDAATRVLETAQPPISDADSVETRADIPTLPRAVATGAPVARTAEPRERKPRGRTRILPLVILALAVSVGGGGYAWWNILGPGAVTSSATIVGLTTEAATTALTDAGFTVVDPPGEDYSPTVAAGLVMGTNPSITAGLPKGTTVRLVVSLGPQPVPVPDFAGATTLNYTATLQKLGLTVAGTTAQFSTNVPSGTVIGVARHGGKKLTVGETLNVGDSVDIIESVGPLPAVSGLSVEAATSALTGADLTVSSATTSKFSSSITSGLVIGLAGSNSTIHPGDTVTLVVSKGPEMISIPSVAGLTLADARSTLTGLGFQVSVSTDIPEKFWGKDWAKAAATDPVEGTSVAKGSTITLSASAN